MLLDILKISEICFALFLIFFVLIQNKNVALNLTSMSGWMWAITKRGPEKILHNLTIILGTGFIINSLALFLLS